MRHLEMHRLAVLGAALALCSCRAEPPGAKGALGSAGQGLELTLRSDQDDGHLVEHSTLVASSADLETVFTDWSEIGGATDVIGEPILTSNTGTWTFRVARPLRRLLDAPDRSSVSYRRQSAEIRVRRADRSGAMLVLGDVTGTVVSTRATDVLELSVGSTPLTDLEVIETYEVLAGGRLRLVRAQPRLLASAMAARSGVSDQFEDRPTSLTSSFVPTSCEEKSIVAFGPRPSDMPPVTFPEVQDCQTMHWEPQHAECIRVLSAWMELHYWTWRVMQVAASLDSRNPANREWAWSRPAYSWGFQGPVAGDGCTSLEFWFGPYHPVRYAGWRHAMQRYWDRVRHAVAGHTDLKLVCRYWPEDQYNLCYTSDVSPAGHHETIGKINICVDNFAVGTFDDPARVGKLVGHELFHILWFQLDGQWRLIGDVVSHAHGDLCSADRKSERIYGEDEIRHLVTYRNSKGSDCGHLDKNLTVCDTHALYISTLGKALRAKSVTSWPMPADPTPQPPSCVGGEGCLCETVAFDDAPDGDFAADKFCTDNDGQLTCVRTKVNASSTVGICKRCDTERGPGCECDHQRPCAVGTCFGDDTRGGGVGHCFLDPPPDWMCLADCQRLFNSPAAWCWHDYPGGRARCIDPFCEPWDVLDCLEAGGVCRSNQAGVPQCVNECVDDSGCLAAGYPGSFRCIGGACQFPLD